MVPRLLRPHRLLLLGLAALLTACGRANPDRGPAPTDRGSGSGDQPMQVVTTFLPITLFTRAVAGSCAEVTALIPPGGSPHEFQASPASLVSLRRARVLVKNGLGMESFLEPLVRSAENPRLRVIDSSRGVATLISPDHAQQQEDHAHHDHGAVNPHIWLDPLRAVQQVNTIRDGLVQADPGCAATYRRNAAAYTARLTALHAELNGQLRPHRGRSFVAFHDVAPYFAERYGLRATFLVDVPEQNPSPQDLQRVAQEVERSQLRALLSEPQQGKRSFNALAEDLGVRISVFDPMESGDAQAAADPGTYLAVMRRNTANLLQAIAR
jgi:zinc transport system substrate-binding protein